MHMNEMGEAEGWVRRQYVAMWPCGHVVLIKSPSVDQRNRREPGLRNNRMMSM